MRPSVASNRRPSVRTSTSSSSGPVVSPLHNIADPRLGTPTGAQSAALPKPPEGHDEDVAGLHGRLRIQKGSARDGSWMDQERKKIQAYEYLCHIGEAKEWIEACIGEEIGDVTVLEEELRNGIALAKLAKSFSPQNVKRIFEDRSRLQFRHSDNINCLFAALIDVGLPRVFMFELTDLYEKKNIPKVIYCIHALSHFLAGKGIAPGMNNLVGKLEFTDEQLDATKNSLEKSGVQMPQFSNLENALAAAEAKRSPSAALPSLPPLPPATPKVDPEVEKRLARERYLKEHEADIAKIQALARGRHERERLQEEKRRADEEKRRAEEEMLRAEENKRRAEEERLRAEEEKRRAEEAKQRLAEENARKQADMLRNMNFQATKIQSAWRMYKARQDFLARLTKLRENEWLFTKLQARVRGKKARLAYKARQQYFKENEASITKIQALWRAKHAKKAYKALAALHNPDMRIVQEFIHLLDDGDQDFEDELDLEDLRQLVIKKIRETIQTEQDLNELDLKIALLVKNRISLEEVVLSTRRMKMKLELATIGAALSGEVHPNPFASAVMDKEARFLLERYQQLFYLLQTQPLYLARLMFVLNKNSGSQMTRFLEHVVLTLFGYAQNTREEYLLLNLIKSAIKVEFDAISDLNDFWRANPLFIKLVLQYIRGAKERQFLRDLLQPLVKSVISEPNLSLEMDPVVIYRSLIRDEESRTGVKSSRPYDISSEQALRDPAVKRIQNQNAEKLIEITNRFLEAIVSSVKKIPYSLRYISMELKEVIKAKFPDSDSEVSKIVGNFIYYRYMNPAIVAPEGFDVIEKQVAPAQRRNLAEVARVLHQISVNRTVEGDGDVLSKYISQSAKLFRQFFNEASTVISAEEYFNMDQFIDMSRHRKPSIFITPNEIYQIHAALSANVEMLISEPNDALRVILMELGPAPALSERDQGEVYLTLVNRFAKIEDESETRMRQLLTETKRLVISVLRVQYGRNLLSVLESATAQDQERTFQEQRAAETERYLQSREKKRAQTWRGPAQPDEQPRRLLPGPEGEAPLPPPPPPPKSLASLPSMYFASGSFVCLKPDDQTSLTFSALKRRALENMAKLEALHIVTKKDNYQDMLNMIAKDMLNRHRRKTQRKREYESLTKTLHNLEEKSAYLDEQKKSYQDYINTCIAQQTKKSGKNRRGPIPFTRQYFHVKELQKAGTMPQFGSFKYTVSELMKKGVIISIDESVPKQYSQMTLTISSDEPGVFKIEAAVMGVRAGERLEVRLEDLLQSQYNGVQSMTLFDIAKVNVNLLTYLLNKKFYV